MLLLPGMFAEPAYGTGAELGASVQLSSTLLLLRQQTALQRGLVALRENHPEEALEDLTKAEAASPKDASIRNFRGVVLVQLGRMAEADAEYREAIRLEPLSAVSYRNLGFLEWNEHKLEAAAVTLRHALTLLPGDDFALYYLGRVELELQQYAAAAGDLGRSSIPLPDEPDVLMAALKAYLAAGKQHEAEALTRRLESGKLTGRQTSRVASLLFALHQQDAAMRVLQHWTSSHVEDSGRWARFDLALVNLMTGSYGQAAEWAGHLLKPGKKPLASREATQAAEASSLIGIANAHLSQPDAAVHALRRAVDFDPGKEEHWLNLTRELMELSRFTDAIATTREAIAQHPASYALQLRLGAADVAINHFDEAETVFRHLIAAGDPLPTSAIGLAQVLLRTGRAGEAAAELSAARQRLGPGFLLSYFQGLACNRANNVADAAAAFRAAVQEDPNSAEAHAELGKTELKLGHFDQAIAEMQRALALDPSNEQAQHLMKQARQRAGTQGADPAPDEIVPVLTRSDPAGDFILPEWEEPPGGESAA